MRLPIALIALALVADVCLGCGGAVMQRKNAATARQARIVSGLGPSGHEDEDGDYDLYRGGGDAWRAAAAQDEAAVSAVIGGHAFSSEDASIGTSRLDSDRDSDNHKAAVYFGRSASGQVQREVDSVVRRYVRAGADGRAATGCALLTPALSAAASERYGRSPALRGHSCESVVAKLFALRHKEFTFASRELQLITVRSHRDEAIAFLSFAQTGNGRQIVLRRLSHRWRLDALLDGELPFDGEAP